MRFFQTSKTYFTILVAVALVGTIGCEPDEADLEPAVSDDPIEKLDEPEIADPNTVATSDEGLVKSVQGVSMSIVSPEDWPGYAEIGEVLTPMRIRIENKSQMPLRVRYGEFALVGLDGTRFSVLPPYKMKGYADTEEFALAQEYEPIAEPVFEYREYEVAPVYDPIYEIDVYEEEYDYDYDYYETYDLEWNDETKLPTDEMLVRALPEGVVQPGGYVQGYLYFEKVPETVERVTFRADLVNAKTEKQFGEIRALFENDA